MFISEKMISKLYKSAILSLKSWYWKSAITLIYFFINFVTNFYRTFTIFVIIAILKLLVKIIKLI